MSEEIESTQESEITKVDPKVIEAEMLADAKKRSEDPVEQAAMLFTMYRPNFIKAMSKVSSRGRLRVMEALVLMPLVNVTLVSSAEKEAYYFGDSMLQAKFIMMQSTYKEHAEELLAAKDLADSATVMTEYIMPEVTNESV